jgi:peptidoglycan/LPS O-acetylase OafA/YrhL
MSRNAPHSNDRLATLDLLRLLAALAVVAFHYLFRGAAGEPMLDVAFPEAERFAIFGYLGVNLFFLISGFVIAWSAEGRDFTGFAIARFARLYPGFLVCMAASFVVLALAADPRWPVESGQFAANLAIFAPALGKPFVDGVYWSIVLEIVFYGWVALALLFGVFERWKLPLVAGWLGLCVLNEFLLHSGALRMVFVTEFGPWFAGGILMHHLWSRGVSAEALMLLGASFLVSCNMLAIAQGWMDVHYGRSIGLGALLAANLAMHALLVAAIAARGLVPATPLVLALGGLTYPLYLLHQNIGYLAINALSGPAGRWGAAALVTGAMLLLSWAIWRFVDTPLRPGVTRTLRAVSTHLPAWKPRAAVGNA